MIDFFRGLVCVSGVCLACIVVADRSAASAGLANPAATHCIAQGGLYGIAEGDDGQRGICVLPDGSEVDAWAFLRQSHDDGNDAEGVKIANPAASLCAAIGGTYELGVSLCRLPSGAEVDAWALLREASTPSLANPAASYCIEKDGAYRIVSGENGQFGLCTLPDGTEIDAWTLFRQQN